MSRSASILLEGQTSPNAERDLARSFDACRAIARAHARNFYFGMRLTPEPRRSAIYAIYAWMRVGDDLVDDAPTSGLARERLDAFRARTHAALAGNHPDSARSDEPFWPAFAATVRAFRIDRAWLDAMLLGLASDIDPAPPANEPGVDAYCSLVAGSVGCCCVRIWGLRPGVDEPEALRLAELRGRAFQRTNILRDVATDLALSPPRCYLAADALARHALDAPSLVAWRDPTRCAALIREQAALAQAAYEASAPLDGLVASDCRAVLRTMTRIYRALLDSIIANPRLAVSTPRARLPRWRKLSIAAAEALAQRFRPLAGSP